jgi:hypothetical protein
MTGLRGVSLVEFWFECVVTLSLLWFVLLSNEFMSFVQKMKKMPLTNFVNVNVLCITQFMDSIHLVRHLFLGLGFKHVGRNQGLQSHHKILQVHDNEK